MRGWETVMSEYRKVPFVTKEKLEEIIADVPTPFHI